MNPNDILHLDPAQVHSFYRVDDSDRYLDPNLELMMQIIIVQVKKAVGRGHDAHQSYKQRMLEQQEYLNYIKSDDFAAQCDLIGLDIDKVLPRILRYVGKANDGVYQIVFDEMECVG